MKLECWNRFDRKVMLYYTEYRNTRAPQMEKELERVGLDGADRQWQYPSPLDEVMLRSMAHIPCCERNGYFNCTMGHYRAIATAYHLGCKSVLIMEDDISFLKDLSEIEATVNSIPEDYDVALLDSFAIAMKDINAGTVRWLREHRRTNEHWAEFDELRSCGCYALSRRGMERMKFCYEAVETAKAIGRMRLADHFLNRKYLGKDSRLYFATKNVAVQRDMVGAMSQVDGIQRCYVDMGLDMSEYEEKRS